MRTIYFDYNATTPLDPQVREAMLPYLGEIWGNPSSVHRVGRHARAMLDEARERVAQVWQCKPSEVIFTSGGTESVNLALIGAARLLKGKGRHIVTTTVEHHAVLHACKYLAKKEGFEVTYLPVNGNGLLDFDNLSNSIRSDTTLVSIMAANNVTGVLQNISAIGKFCREKGVVFHTDAVQVFGKETFVNIHQFNADLVSVCAHKLFGPKGAGALFIRSPLKPEPILWGGGQENEFRAGTENLAGVIGFKEGMERFVTPPVFPRSTLTLLTEHLMAYLEGLLGPDGKPLVKVWGDKEMRLCNTICFTAAGCESMALLANLDLEGICASGGSACSSGSLEPSHVILAMGGTAEEAKSLVRFSLGPASTMEEVLAVEAILGKVIRRVKGMEKGVWRL